MKNVIQAYQGQAFSVTLESMLASTNCGWCLMSMSEHVVLSGQPNILFQREIFKWNRLGILLLLTEKFTTFKK